MILILRILFLAFSFFNFVQAAQVAMHVGHVGHGGQSKASSIKVSREQPFMVTVSVDPEGDDLPEKEPEIVGSQDFKVGQASQGWSIVEVNGVLKSKTYDFHYYFQPLKEGNFKIGPASCIVDGQEIESDMAQVSVAKAENVKDFFAKATVSKDPSGQSDEDEKIFAGQKAWLTIKICINKNSFDYLENMEIERPETHDIEIGEPVQGFKQGDEYLGGKVFRTWERKFPFVPLKSGLLDIMPFKIKYEISRRASAGFGFGSLLFRNSNTGAMLTNDGIPLGIDVCQVPDNVMAIGRGFKVAIGFERDKIKVGQPTVLVLEVAGSGDFDKILHPNLNLPEQLRVYESKSDNLVTSRAEKQKGFEQKKRFEYIVQASKPGIYQVPEQEFIYFDTASEDVVTEKTRPFSFKVVADENDAVVQDQELEVIDGGTKSVRDEQDKQLAKRRAEMLSVVGLVEQYKGGGSNSGRGIAWQIFMLLLLVPLVVLFWREINSWIEAKNRSRRARSRALKETTKAHNSDNLRAVYYIFIRYFSARWGVSQEAVNVEWLGGQMKQISMANSRIEDFFAFFNQAASLAFGRESHKYGPLESEAFFKKAAHWITTIDEYKKAHEEGKKQ